MSLQALRRAGLALLLSLAPLGVRLAAPDYAQAHRHHHHRHHRAAACDNGTGGVAPFDPEYTTGGTAPPSRGC